MTEWSDGRALGAADAGVAPPTDADAGVGPAEVEARLAAIEHALQRLEAGTYWLCATCGAPLDEGDLELDPAATRCRAHAEPLRQDP